MKHAENISYAPIEPDPDPEDARSEQRKRRRSGPGIYVVSVLLSGAAIALGAYAWQLLEQREKLESDVAGLVRVRDQAEQRVAQLVAEHGQEQARSIQATTERDELRAALEHANAELAALKAENAADEAQLAELRELRAKFQRMIDSGTLDITLRRGRMIVELPSRVLFDSGSAELSREGQETVTQVAKILRSVPRHRFLVAGHTDNVPAVKQYKSNWELSAARAVRVTEMLTRQGMPPKRLVIAGYSEHDPVASNASDAGRQKNRRIEIILEPYVEQKLAEKLLSPKPGDKPPATKPGGASKAAPASKAAEPAKAAKSTTASIK